MEYDFRAIEQRWQAYWKDKKIGKTKIDHNKPKCYVLDMFPYPSGKGLHVGHPLGYVASDIYARYKSHKGFNVLHPMGYDAFGLPAEQYAIQTGQHPAITTENNIRRYRRQLEQIGLSYDWDREVRTCDPKYYHWTQWAFIKMFQHWYNNDSQKAEPIETLIKTLETKGNISLNAVCNADTPKVHAAVWNGMNEAEQQKLLMNYRIAFLADTMVNWCPELGTVLANDEVVNGMSVRGGHPVVQRLMKQWNLRVSAYAQRLLNDLDKLEWSDSLKEIQRNWIGRSEGAQVFFTVEQSDIKIEIFTTRPDTIYGATFMVLAPEHDLVKRLTTTEQQAKVQQYIAETLKRSERERQMDVKRVSGVFTGSYALNPFTKAQMPVWISDYVLAGYGTGAIMAVPAHDSRDYAFATHFELPIVRVIEGGNLNEGAYDAKSGKMISSGMLNGMDVSEAITTIVAEIEKRGLGTRQINYRLRDAIFSRQRYWGEPFPVFYKEDLPYPFPEDQLPLKLPNIDEYKPTEDGQPPLGRAKDWVVAGQYPIELNTMPGFAGSSAYYLRYMDPHNDKELVSEEANKYWRTVDLYIGGNEHATGHLIYSRFWNKFLFDLGKVVEDEPFQKLINPGMIQGRSSFVYRVNNRKYAESLFWTGVKGGQLGYKFTRDYRFQNEIYAFFCEEKRLMFENCNTQSAQEFYEQHAQKLKSAGIDLLIVTTEELIADSAKVLKRVQDILNGEEEIQNEFSDTETPYTPLFVSYNLLKDNYQASPIHVDISMVKNDELNIEAFRKWRLEYEHAQFILEDGKYICGHAVEKMSKSLYNVVNPDNIIAQYGADTYRLYEMFLGPLEQSKPWDTNGIEGVHKFLRKAWRLFHNTNNEPEICEESPTKAELKALHKAIQKISDDIERFSFNTAVSAFMICVNELSDLKCNKREILEPFVVLLSPFAPHIAEELWHSLGHKSSVTQADYPAANPEYLKEDSITYPISFNGKRRFELEIPIDMPPKEIEELVLHHENTKKWIEGKTIRKVIVVPKKIVNIVI